MWVWNLRRPWEKEDVEEGKFERGTGQWICESGCWDSDVRWIWDDRIELKNRYEKRCNV